MGRVYTAVFEDVSVSAAQDLFELNAPSDAIVKLHSVTITQSSEEGDAQAEMLPVRIRKGQTTSGSGGSSPTATPSNTGDSAFGGSVEANNTTQASGGTPVVWWAEAFNVQIGWFYLPPPEDRLVLSPSQRATVELTAAPADAMTVSGTIVFEEIGG